MKKYIDRSILQLAPSMFTVFPTVLFCDLLKDVMRSQKTLVHDEFTIKRRCKITVNFLFTAKYDTIPFSRLRYS
jgi:hypothetical protein